jgi:hypothetical protein
MKIWNQRVRSFLYEQLVKHCGPLHTWETTSRPGYGRDPAFEAICAAVAKSVRAKSVKAVKHQIAFALPVKGKAYWANGGHSANAVLNLAAALDAGFIRWSDVPALTATPRGTKP